MNIIAKYVHGSANSLDIDVMYVVDELPPLRECKEFCSDKIENRNLIVIRDGVVAECYKGTPDECNNSLLATYKLHGQNYGLLVNRPVGRDLKLKAIRAVRTILSHLSRTQYRPEIKRALKSPSWNDRMDVLRTIRLADVDFDHCQKNMSGADVKKLIAFQSAQTAALACGFQLYTKDDVSGYFKPMKKFMDREDESIDVLQCMVDLFRMRVEKLDMAEYDLLSEKKKRRDADSSIQ